MKQWSMDLLGGQRDLYKNLHRADSPVLLVRWSGRSWKLNNGSCVARRHAVAVAVTVGDSRKAQRLGIAWLAVAKFSRRVSIRRPAAYLAALECQVVVTAVVLRHWRCTSRRTLGHLRKTDDRAAARRLDCRRTR